MKDSEIENRFSFQCQKKWEELTRTSDDGVKLCNQCNESVYLAESVEELDSHAEHNRCVALHLKDCEGLEQEVLTGFVELDEPLKRQLPENEPEVMEEGQFEMLGRLRLKEEYAEPAKVTKPAYLDMPRIGRVPPSRKNSLPDGQPLEPEQYLRSPGAGNALPYKKPSPQKGKSMVKRLLNLFGFN